MAILKKDQILAADSLPREEVEMPEWGGSVYVRTMTAKERSQYQTSVMQLGKDNTTYTAKLEGADVRLAAICTVDEENKPLFTEAEMGERNAACVNRLVEVAQRLNAITKKDVDQLVGNSEAIPNSDSASS